ncbi:MAG: hypothetical protein IJW66_04295 [Clostridia bacterium]|nr:hypothetical protein [Clostridia bacterium]
MTKRHSTKRSLIASLLILCLCFTSFVGTTFAWFTDEVTSANNIIKSGTLDITMEWKDATATGAQQSYKDASEGAIFNYDKWEPGYVEAKHVKIGNAGTLALKYQLAIVATDAVSELSDVIDVYFAEGELALDRSLSGLTRIGTLTEVLSTLSGSANGDLKAGETDTVTLALKMQESAGNEYQNLSIGSSFQIKCFATQLTSESDSFDTDYDKDAGFDFGKNNIGPYKLNVLSGGLAEFDGETKTYSIDVKTVAQGGYNASQGGNFFAGYTVNVAGYGEGATISFDKADGSGVSVWKLADEERDGFINNGVHQQWTRAGRKTAYRYDIDGDGVTDFTVVNDASAAVVEIADETGLKNAIAAGNNVALANDITVSEGVVVSAGKSITLDLNGHDIIGTSTSAESVELFSVSGNLEIVGEGTISLKNDNYEWTESYRYTAINIRETGVVTLGEGVNVVCEAGANTARGYGMAYAVDIYTTGTLNVNGASLHSNYIAVRCFYGNSVVNVNGGSITSSRNNWGIWPQSAPGAVITVADGIAYEVGDYGIYIFG